MLPTRITLDSPDTVTVHLRDGHAVSTARSHAILDVNHEGRWIRGVELLGGIDFDLARAVAPLKPRKPQMGESDGVTYDKEANAAFIYFSMKSPGPSSPSTALKYAHSITPEAEFGFDANEGLLWLRFSCQEENGSSADFVSLINAPVEGSTET
jgi:hypothetical protein